MAGADIPDSRGGQYGSQSPHLYQVNTEIWASSITSQIILNDLDNYPFFSLISSVQFIVLRVGRQFSSLQVINIKHGAWLGQSV